MQVETNSPFIWIPSKFVTLWGTFGVQMYELTTWLALIGGTIGWWFLINTLLPKTVRPAFWKKVAALVVIGISVLIFTRLFHILFWGLDQTITHPKLLLQVDRGRSIHGTIFGFGVSAILIARLWKTPVSMPATAISFWPMLSLICARIGNFWNSESIGTPSSWPFSVGFYFSADRGAVLRHPVQLYEAGLAVILLFIILYLSIKKEIRSTNRPYVIPAITLCGYSAIRFCCDFVKEEPGYLIGSLLSTGQWLSIPFFALGMLLFFFPFHKTKREF